MSLLHTNWPTAPLGRLVSINERALAETTHSDYTFRYLDISAVGRGEITEEPKTMRFENAPSRARRILRSGDTIVSTVRTYLRAVLPIQDDADDLIASTGFAVLSPGSSIDSRFLSWYAQADPFIEQVVARSVGVSYPAIAPTDLARFPVPNPTLPEQRAIADYLDAETARIDALIEKKRRQSVLVDARWVALVTDLIRGRHTAFSRLKESGVDWIGALPEEWGTPTVGMMFDVELGKMLNQRAAEGENQLRYLRNQNVQWDRFDLDDVSTMHFESEQRQRFGVRKGDLLVCEGGDVGRAAMWSLEEEICYQKALHRVRPRTVAPPRFLMYVLWAASLLGVFTIEGNQSTIVHLTREQLRTHRMPWPREDQQHQIVAELDKARAKMRNLQEKWSQQIKLLTEHRQALITAAVTGQIGVPGIIS